MKKTAKTAFPIHDLLAERWSPRAFRDAPVDAAQLRSLLEAARWSASCFNAQPWSFLVATRDEDAGFERLASCLMEGNAWAREAPVLILTVARREFEHNGKPNRHAWHDVGIATASLVLQAQALGLSVHAMAGFDAGRARAQLSIPEEFDPVAVLAVGHRGEPDGLPDALKERELAPRERKDLDSFVFRAAWGESLGG